MSIKRFFLLIVMGILLQACGQVGPLYHPDEAAPIYVPDEQYPDEDQ